MKTKRISTGKYIPDPEIYDSFIKYTLDNPGEQLTYEGYLVFKMKKILEKEGEKECLKQS